MGPLIGSVKATVAQDVRELVYASQVDVPEFLEKDPPNWRWHLPLVFDTLAAAGTLLIAAGGLHRSVQERKHGARPHQTRMHKQKVRPGPVALR